MCGVSEKLFVRLAASCCICKVSFYLFKFETVSAKERVNGFMPPENLMRFTFRHIKFLCRAKIQVPIILFRSVCTWRWRNDLFCAICHKSVVLFPFASFVDRNWIVIGKPQLFC